MIKTIVYVYDQAYVSGGAAKIAIGAAAALSRAGYRVIYFAALGPVDEALSEAGVETVIIGGEHIGKTKSAKALLRALWNKQAEKKLCSLLEGLNPEETVVHIHGWTKSLSSSVFAACRKSGVRAFVTLHEYFSVCGNGGLYNFRKGCICDLKPNSAKCLFCNCDKNNYLNKAYRSVRQLITNRALKRGKPNVIYITEFSRRVLEPKIGFANKSFLVENHVDTVRTDKTDVKNNSEFLFIGRVSDEKAPDLFCEAVTAAGVTGTVIGEGPMREKLAREYPDIKFTGWMPSAEVGEYLGKARCVVVSSRCYETMGLTVIEAQNRGVPCVVPDKCAAVEYIDDGKNGLVFSTGDAQNLASKLELMKDSDFCSKLSDRFYDEYEPDRFSMSRHTAELVKVYENKD